MQVISSRTVSEEWVEGKIGEMQEEKVFGRQQGEKKRGIVEGNRRKSSRKSWKKTGGIAGGNKEESRARILNFKGAQESIPRIQCSLAGRYDNPIPTRFLAPIVGLKIPAQEKKH